MSDDMNGWDSDELSDSAADSSANGIGDELGGGDYSAPDLGDDDLSTDDLSTGDLSNGGLPDELAADELPAGDALSGLTDQLSDQVFEAYSGPDDVYDPTDVDSGDSGDSAEFDPADLATGAGDAEFVEPGGETLPGSDLGPNDTEVNDTEVNDALDPVATLDPADSADSLDSGDVGTLDPATDGLSAELPHAADADPFPPALDPADFGGVEPADGLDWADPEQLGDADQLTSLDAGIPEPSAPSGIEALVDPESGQSIVAELAGVDGADPAESSDPGLRHLSTRWG